MTERMTSKAYKSAKPKRRNKFNAVKVKDDGYTFDSKREHRQYLVNKARLKKGEIADLKIHPKYEIVVNGQLICRYTADSSYFEVLTPFNGGLASEFVVEDVKSQPTRIKRDYRLVLKLMKAVHGIEIREVL